MAVSFCGKRVILSRSCLFKTTKRKHGYIILLPEIGEDLPEKNPLVKENGLPEFNTFTIERSIAAIGKQTVEFEQGVKRIEEHLQDKKDINILSDLLHPLEEVGVPLETTWGIAKALYFGNQSLMPTKYFENIVECVNKARNCSFVSLPIYNLCKATLENKDAKLTNSQQRILAKMYLNGRLNGLELTGKPKKRFTYARERLAAKSKDLQNMLEITLKMFKHTITNPNVVRDFPEDYLKMIAEDPTNPQKGSWKVTLQPHIEAPFMELCPNRELRWNVWQAKVSRLSVQNDDYLYSSGTIEDIRYYRMEQAKALGYESYSHMSMETKMAQNLDNLYNVLDTLLQAARPVQAQELEELDNFARNRGFDDCLQEWDIDYWARKYRRSVLNVKDEILRDYFPLPKVLKGLFDLTERLFNVRIVETRKPDVWHADVRFFDVIDLKESSDEPIASFYLDPYARREIGLRMEKDAGWMVTMRNLSVCTSTRPLAALIFNFQRPTNDKPSLLSFKDVAVLFQKFGQALQHLLTKADLYEVAGLSNVEWDAVGVSAHFLANWLYEPSVIRQLSSHYDTSEPLPEELVERLRNIRSHLAGYRLCKELYLSKLDLELHGREEFWIQMMERLWKEHFIIPIDKINGHVCSWQTVFIGGWGAAYYSDLWASMVAADAYSAFQEIPAGNEALEKETALRYRETFLSLGGSVPAAEIFRRFRGRDPNPKALLRNLGVMRNETKCLE